MKKSLSNCNYPMPTPPRRRWFQFGLATMFVVITVMAPLVAWVGRSLNWIQQRHNECQLQLGDLPVWRPPILVWRLPEGSAIAPEMLWLFGEEGVAHIGTYGDEVQRAKVKSLFPEARVDLKEN